MQINDRYKGRPALEIWEIVCAYVAANGRFRSVTGTDYFVQLRNNAFFYKGGRGKRAREGEYLDKATFLDAYRHACQMAEVNTGTVKPYIARRQTGFIGLLLSSGILSR